MGPPIFTRRSRGCTMARRRTTSPTCRSSTRANALATSSPPLLTISLANPNGSAMPVGTLELTAHGRNVLLGQADRLQLCGIDRWLGGVCLQGRGPVWRWSRHAGHLIEA